MCPRTIRRKRLRHVFAEILFDVSPHNTAETIEVLLNSLHGSQLVSVSASQRVSVQLVSRSASQSFSTKFVAADRLIS